MTRRVRLAGALAAAVVAAAAASPLVPLAAAGPAAPDVPSTIAVVGAHKVFLVTHAVGVQIYPCLATSSGFAWGPTTPRANLYGDAGQLVGTHFGGPTWQARDGSTVVGKRVDGVTVDATAIPWLLLSATPAAGADGDRLAKTTFIQRVATTGGLAPAAATCNADTVGTVAEVPYTADYYFWKSTGGS